MDKLQANDADPDWEMALIHYQTVIASGSKAMKVKATVKLAHFSKYAPEHMLSRAIPVLVRLLVDTSSSNSTRQAAVYCLKCIACKGDGGALATEIGQSGVVQPVLDLLSHSDCNLRRVSMKCVRCLVNFGSVNRLIVARSGGLETVIDMLDSCVDDDDRLCWLDILSALALLREVRRVLSSLGGLRYLVQAVSRGSMISRERACQAVGLLGITRRARSRLVELGVIPVLVELFREGDPSTKLVAGNSLAVISAHIDFIRPVAEAGAIPLYAELLQGPSPLGKEIAEDAFCILAVDEANALAIAENLVRILREGDDEARAAASDVLWDLSGYNHSVSVVRSSGAIPMLVQLLREGNGEVREKVSGAVAQLSHGETDRSALADAGAVPILIELLHHESEELRDNAAEAIINFSEDRSLHDLVSVAVDDPSFRGMQNRMNQLLASDEHMVRSMRRMSIEQLTWDPDLV